MAWCRSGTKPLPEPIVTYRRTYRCIFRAFSNDKLTQIFQAIRSYWIMSCPGAFSSGWFRNQWTARVLEQKGHLKVEEAPGQKVEEVPDRFISKKKYSWNRLYAIEICVWQCSTSVSSFGGNRCIFPLAALKRNVRQILLSRNAISKMTFAHPKTGVKLTLLRIPLSNTASTIDACINAYSIESSVDNLKIEALF